MKIFAKELRAGDKLGVAVVLEVAYLEGPLEQYNDGGMNFGMRPAWGVVLLKLGERMPSEPDSMGTSSTYRRLYNDWAQGDAEVEVERAEE